MKRSISWIISDYTGCWSDSHPRSGQVLYRYGCFGLHPSYMCPVGRHWAVHCEEMQRRLVQTHKQTRSRYWETYFDRARIDGMLNSVLHFREGENHKGSAPLISYHFVPYEAQHGQIRGWSFYNDTNKTAVMLTHNAWVQIMREAITTNFEVGNVTWP